MKTDLEFIADALRHDCTERRHTSMHRILIALENMAMDGDAIARGELPPELGYDIARRARKALDELEGFRARDLVNMRDSANRVDL